MKTLTCCMTLVALLFCQQTFAQSSKCSVVGMSISKKKEGNKYGQGYIPGTMEGVRVYVRVPVGKNIISISEENLPKIFDDKDKDLSGKRRSMSLRYMADYSEDKQTAVIPINASKLPPAGCKSLNIKGKFKFNCGLETKDEMVSFEMKTGAKTKMAGLDVEVRKIAKGFGREESTRITFRSNKSFEHVKSVFAVDADGNESEGRSAGMSSFGFRDKKTFDQTFEFPGKQDSISKVKVVYFHKTEEVEVPVELSFSLGF